LKPALLVLKPSKFAMADIKYIIPFITLEAWGPVVISKNEMASPIWEYEYMERMLHTPPNVLH
jgi:hypothetical protein